MKTLINIYFLAFAFFLNQSIQSQKLSATIESDSILIGNELLYKIDINLDEKQSIVFPDSTSFVPFELISETKVDTLENNEGFIFSKKYGITSFDEGEFIIPKIKVQIGDKFFSTDSKKIKVNMVEVDTTKQGLYEIKPSYGKFSSLELFKLRLKNNYQIILIAIFLILAIVYFRKQIFNFFNPLLNITPSLSPLELVRNRMNDLAKMKINSNHEIKFFYSQLTFSLRSFFEKEVYDRALESTTNELITGLNNLRELKQVSISKNSINRIKEIFNRADLVKFAKFLPEKHIIEKDLKVISEEINIFSRLIPEPSEEQKLKDLNYQKEVINRLRNKRLRIVSFSLTLLLFTIFVLSGFLNGFQYTFDRITFNENARLLEKAWIKSEYGSPGIFLQTPEALTRQNENYKFLFDDFNLDSQFYFSNSDMSLELFVSNYSSKTKIDPENFQFVLESKLDDLEEKGLQNILLAFDEFETNNKAKGLIISGSSDYRVSKNNFIPGKYSVIGFLTETGFKTIVLLQHEVRYLDKIGNRILSSIDVLKEEKK
tara:strand:- start:1279 stop:2910 length:1632 start_codon:yes stop_codon:yes gene_type:complete